MTDSEEIAHLWGLALTKKSGWQYSDFPVVRDKSSKFAEAWKKSKTKVQYSTGKPVTIELVEQYWYAEARARKLDRERGAKVPQPVGITVWVNDERWNNGITLESDEQPKDSKLCKCGQPVHGPDFNKCTTCLPYENGKLTGILSDELREYYRAHPELQTMTPAQCREMMLKFLGG